jgi:oligopeptide/dipeptide ABC transporter ATP-binding protein
LIEPTAGSITFDGRDVLASNRTQMKSLRRDIQMIFQDPMGSLNPRMKVGEIISEGLLVHHIGTRTDRADRVREMLQKVGLSPEAADRYPYEFSGGGHQRIAIARALVLEPKFIVADEPVSALDVSIQSQVLNLLSQLKRELGLTFFFVGHDIAVVGYMADRIAVMYLGKVVEIGPARSIYERPLHPYTMALISAIPVAKPGHGRRRIILTGDVPSPIDPPSGCRFRTRCPLAQEICTEIEPPLEEKVGGHMAACHFAGTPLTTVH